MRTCKMTIAQLREKQLEKLATITNDYEIACNLMNRYYRLAGMDTTLLYLENDARTCDSRYTMELVEKRDNAFKRLDKDFHKYGLMLVYYGYIPTITNHKGGNAVIDTYFYN